MPKYFIDSHCHLFNIEDIPLYSTIGKVEGLPNSVLAVGALFGAHKILLKLRKAMASFFDSTRSENVAWMANGVSAAIAGHSLLAGRKIIIIPLVMDFDRIESSLESVEYQTCSLRSAIQAAGLSPEVQVLPFVGLDLRKISECGNVEKYFDRLLDACQGMKPKDDRAAPAKMKNGDIAGVKLYPSMGFNPFSDNGKNKIDPKRLMFYKICARRSIPITVHCQRSSYYGHDIDKEKSEKLTHPVNWERVMAALGNSSGEFRINFAHFGGEDEIKKAVLNDMDFNDRPGPREKISDRSWVYVLLRLLKQYPHTYADIAAFDYSDKVACLALAWLLVLDENGKLDEKIGMAGSNIKLKDKLLWGTDVPMILGKKAQKVLGLKIPTGHVETYKPYLDAFVEALDIANIKAPRYQKPKEKDYIIPLQQDLVDAFTYRNPMRFLFNEPV